MKHTLQWHHNGCDGVSNHQPHDCLLNCLFRRRSKKTSKLRVTDLCAGNSPVTGEFPAQMTSHMENVSIWWRHHEPKPVPIFWSPLYVSFICMELSHYAKNDGWSMCWHCEWWMALFCTYIQMSWRSVRRFVNTIFIQNFKIAKTIG